MKRPVNKSLAILVLLLILVSGCTKSPDEKRAAYLESAGSYLAEGKYAEAAIQYQNALQIAPDDAKTLVALGEAQLKLMRANEAYKAFAGAAKADPKNTKAHEYLASMQLLAKKYDMAEKEASIILSYEPGNREAKEIRAQAFFNTGKKTEAVSIMEELVKASKPSEATLTNTVQMYMATGRADDALSLLNRAVSLYPKSSRIRFLGSDIYAFKGDLNLARTWAEDGYKSDKNNINAGLTLARFYAGHNMDDLFKAQLSELKTRFPKESSPYLLESGYMQSKKDTPKALALAEKALSIQDNAMNRTVVAQLLLEKGDTARAEKLLKEAVEKDPKAPSARMLLTQVYLKGGNAQKALDTIDMLVKNIPKRPDVAVLAGQAYLMKGDVTKAKDIVEKALEESKNNAALHITMAKIDYAQGKHKETLSEIDLLGKHAMSMPDLLYIGALSALRLDQKDRAATFAGSLKQISPESWPSLHAQCLIALSKNDKQGAYRIADRAVDLYPQKSQALVLYAGIAPAVIKKEDVIRKVSGICSKSSTPPCHLVLAGLLEASGNKDGALSQLKEAVRLNPEDASLTHALAQFYMRNNMVKQAMNEYETLVNKNPKDTRAAFMLAQLNQSQGNIADARKVYSFIMEREPKNALAANNLAWILADTGKPADLNEAQRLAQIAKEKYPDDPRIADTLGYVYLKKGMSENALAQFQLAIEKMPQEPSINYHMALALVKLSRNPEARKYAETALSVKGEFMERAEAQKLLARINTGAK